MSEEDIYTVTHVTRVKKNLSWTKRYS